MKSIDHLQRGNMTRFSDDESIAAVDNTQERIRRLEERLNLLENRLPQTYLQGRLRTDYTSAPANSADVNDTNQLYDYIILPTAEYILINNSGSLAWRQITLSSF